MMQATRRAAMACIVTVLVHMYSGISVHLYLRQHAIEQVGHFATSCSHAPC